MKKTLGSVVLACSLIVGCKKDEKAPPPKADKVAAVKPPEVKPEPVKPPEVKPVVGEALAKWMMECDAHAMAGTWDKYQACFADNVSSTMPDSGHPDAKTATEVVAMAKGWKESFPDMKVTPQMVLVNDRNVLMVNLITGTHTGTMKSPMGDVPATGKKIGILIARGAEVSAQNKIVKEWRIADMATFMAQLGKPMGKMPTRPAMETGAPTPMIVVATNNDMEKANLKTFTQAMDSFNKGDIAALMATWTADAIESDQSAPADLKGTAAIEKNVRMFKTAFPEGKIETTSAWTAGDYIVTVGNFTGTMTGDMGPIKKTGKTVKSTMTEIIHVTGGKAKQMWRFANMASFMSQMMGMAPPTATGTPATMGTPATGMPATTPATKTAPMPAKTEPAKKETK